MTIQNETNGNEPDNNGNEVVKRRSRLGLGIGIGIGLIIVLIVAAVAGFFVIRGSEASSLEDGRAAVAAGKWAAAVTALDQVLDTQPAFLRQHDLEATALRGLALYQQGEYNTALVDFEAALENNPDLVDLAVYRADTLYRQGENEGALAGFATALEHKELLPDHLLALLHADQAVIYDTQAQDESRKSETSAAFELGQFLPEERIAILYANSAQSGYAAGEIEETLADTLAALSFDTALSDSSRTGLLADMAAIYFQEKQLELALESSASAIALGTLPEASLADIYQMRAEALFQQGDLDRAITEAEQAVSHGKDEALLRALQALRYYQGGDWAQALDKAEAALAINDDNSLAHRVRGSIYAWQGKTAEALVDLDKALEADEYDVEALAMRVYAQLERNDVEAAKADLVQAQQANPAAAATIFAEAQIDYYNYDYAKSRTSLDLAIELDDSRPEFYTLRAQTYRQIAEDDQVMADLEQALALDDDFPLALARIIGKQVEQYEYDNLEEQTARLIELFPEWYDGYWALAEYHLYTLDDPETAMEYAETMLDLAPESTAGYTTRGYIQIENEAYDLARADFEQALALAPNSLNSVSGLASLYWAEEEYDEALDYLDQVLTIVPDSARARSQQAWIYYEQGESEQAWQKVHEALAQDPDYPEALRMRALVNMDNGDLVRGQLDLHRALELYPNYALAHLAQAWAYNYQGRPAEAIYAAERALELDQRLTGAYFLQISTAWLEDDFEEIERQAYNWIEVDPDSALAYYWLGNANINQGKDQEALDNYNNAFDLLEEDNPLAADIYFERGLANFNLSEEELAQADLEAALTVSTDLDFIDEIEVILASPEVQAESIAGRRIIEDPDSGYTISFDEKWQQWPAEPAEGYVLSLGYGEDDLLASADVYIIDWEPSFSLYELAAVIDMASEGASTQSPVSAQIGGESGLLQTYELEVLGEIILGQQYMVAQGNRAAVIWLYAIEDVFEEFEEEFETMVGSFSFLP